MANFLKPILIALTVTFLFGCQNVPLGNNMIFSNNSDSALTDSVRTAFESNGQLAGTPVQIETVNGIVQLSGYVKTIRQSDTAGDLAAKVPGVKGVQNNIIVRK